MPTAVADVRDFEARKAAEQRKAVLKYGDDALLPAGRPDLDVLDFAINELVGLTRYAAMLEERHRLMEQLLEGVPKGTRALCREGVDYARQLEAMASGLALDGIALRRRLRGVGLQLGLTETAAGIPSAPKQENRT